MTSFPSSVLAQQVKRSLPEDYFLQGTQLLNEGSPWQASEVFRNAYKGFAERNDRQGMVRTQIAQGEAFQSLGQVFKACSTVLAALGFDVNSACLSSGVGSEKSSAMFSSRLAELSAEPLNIKGLGHLGFYLMAVGDQNTAQLVFTKAALLSKSQTIDDADRQLINLGQADLSKLSFLKLRNQGILDQNPLVGSGPNSNADQLAQKAFTLYEQINLSSEPALSLRAKLNWLELYSALATWAQEAEDDSALAQLYQVKEQSFNSIVNQLGQSEFESIPAIESVYGRLLLSEKLLALRGPGESTRRSYDLAVAALKQANDIRSLRGQSFALGLLGQIYQANNQSAHAKTVYQQAISLSQASKAWDSAYQWQWHLAQVLAEEGQREQALSYYNMSVQSLGNVRSELLAVDSELQFAFPTKIAPVYREYISLLLSKPGLSDVDKALNVYTELQSAELENFLGCGRLESVDLAEIDNVPPTFYFIEVEDGYEVVLRKPDGTFIRHKPETASVERSLIGIRNYLDDIQAVDKEELYAILPFGQMLYQQLIAPFESHLPEAGTLNFEADTSFQSVPMGLLHDGSNYLVKNYSLSLTLKDQLLQPKRLKSKAIKSLTLGISKISPSMENSEHSEQLTVLPEVTEEINQVSSASSSSRQFLDQEFTKENLKKSLEWNYPILHIASHGRYSSDPNRSVLFAWDGVINSKDLAELVSSRSNTDSRIELLVLSACQTAVGDPRAALGMAGLSVQSGARSTLASLWTVNSRATSLLMGRFYEGLKNGLTKAEALQQAQLYLLESTEYNHPYHWSGFVLTGSWL